RSVRFSHVSAKTECVRSVMERIWRQAKLFRLVRRSVLLLLSLSANRVHSLPCVPSIQVVLPEMISHRVFPVSRSSSRQESQRDLRLLQNLPERRQFLIQRRNARLLSQMTRQESPRHTSSRMVLGSRYRTGLCWRLETNLQKVA